VSDQYFSPGRFHAARAAEFEARRTALGAHARSKQHDALQPRGLVLLHERAKQRLGQDGFGDLELGLPAQAAKRLLDLSRD